MEIDAISPKRRSHVVDSEFGFCILWIFSRSGQRINRTKFSGLIQPIEIKSEVNQSQQVISVEFLVRLVSDSDIRQYILQNIVSSRSLVCGCANINTVRVLDSADRTISYI